MTHMHIIPSALSCCLIAQLSWAAPVPSSHNPQKDPSPMVLEDAWPALTSEYTLSGVLQIDAPGQSKNLIHVPDVALFALRDDSLHLVSSLAPHDRSETLVIDDLPTDGTPLPFEIRVEPSGRMNLTVGDEIRFVYNSGWRTLQQFAEPTDIVFGQNGSYKGAMTDLKLSFDAARDPRLGIDPQAGQSATMPELTVKEEQGDTNIYIDGKWLLHLRDNQYVLFRSNINNDAWIANDRGPMNLAWNYQDRNSMPLTDKQVDVELLEDGFRLTLNAVKEKASDVAENCVITARWIPEMRLFSYVIDKSISGNQESWKKIDRWARRELAQFEIFDFNPARMSGMVNVVTNNMDRPDLYDGVYFDLNGEGDWIWVPKLPIPRTNRQFPGRGFDGYVYGYHLDEGGKIAIADPKEGGWIVQQTEISGGRRYVEICWSWYDLHFVMRNAESMNDEDPNFEASAVTIFTPLTPAEGKAIIDQAEEVDWADRPEYQVPSVYFDGSVNEFDVQIGGPTGGRDWVDPMMASSPACIWDREIGYESEDSLLIEHDEADELSAWFTYLWRFPGTEVAGINRRYRISGMVKTEDLEGRVMLSAGAGVLGPDNVVFPDASTPGYVISESLTGTNDWTPVELEFTVTGEPGPAQAIFVQEGKGRAWLDHLKIEVLDQ